MTVREGHEDLAAIERRPGVTRDLHPERGGPVRPPVLLARAPVDCEELVGAVGDVEHLTGEDRRPGDLRTRHEAPHDAPVGRPHAVEGAVVGAEVEVVEIPVVHGLRLHDAEGLKPPDGAPVARSKRVEPVVGRADEDAAARGVDPGRPALVVLTGRPTRGRQLSLHEDVDRPGEVVKPERRLRIDAVVRRPRARAPRAEHDEQRRTRPGRAPRGREDGHGGRSSGCGTGPWGPAVPVPGALFFWFF